MTDSESLEKSRIFLELGPRPEEHGRLVRPDARASYPEDVLTRLRAEAAKIIARYPDSRSALLSLLHLVQSEDSCITPAGLDFCSDRLGLSGAEVAAVATFYSMYRREPTGEYFVGVCTNALCAVMGGDAILAALKDHLDVDNGGTTPDGKVTLEHIECNAACDYAPVVMVNWEFYDNQTPESARTLVDSLRTGDTLAPTRGAPLCTFRETARVLAGFPDERPGASAAAGSGGEATLRGLRVAHERGMSAPAVPAAPTAPAQPDQPPADSTKDKAAPAPSATVPPDSTAPPNSAAGKGD
ncbi:NADH-quinone oxidoreductase subunit NuoE [Antrihabitans cavernicola]|uniref:NADH-quinone oxidoreductase subunit NuoE n=1 Tax=Antrihabitans cavernicola TaxID=2495913 RepID=A0A5A7SAP4_9NOCA|nr:NADH-quinone oxidoreductase subunit NuoE [Spelaeibacter cavernicola]KAA0021633.1 NADH-quinone oxidoreductase subunit NuoE [Spelaeibacter cavernicola]